MNDNKNITDNKKSKKKTKKHKTDNTNVNKIAKINTLVLSGGSLKGIAHIGVIDALNKSGVLENIKTFAGTSIGGIILVLYLIGYTPEELRDFINMVNFDIFKNINIGHFLSNFGIDDGKKIMFVLEKMFEAKNINKKITLIELYQKTGKQLILTGVCINDKKLYYLSHETFPDMPVLVGLRITSSIPFLFTPVKYNNKLFIDGGIMNNYPINLFDNRINEVIGVYLNELCCDVESIDNLESYLGNTLECIFEGISAALTGKYQNQTIKLYLPKFSMLGNALSIEDKEKLYSIGYTETVKYLENINN